MFLFHLSFAFGVFFRGFGCAHDIFPSVGSRTSAGNSFIRKTVCDHSEFPPTYFNCDEFATPAPTPEPLPPSMSPYPTVYAVSVTVYIYFDTNPQEVGWKLTDKSKKVVYADHPAGTFADDHAIEEIFLPPGEEYVFTITDAAKNGMEGMGMLYEIILTDKDAGIVLVAGDGHFGKKRKHKFIVPGEDEYPTASPMYPTTSPGPSAFTILVTLTIHFDSWHEETSWSIADVNDPTLLYAETLPGTYRYGDSIVEEIQLPPNQNFTFSIRDSAGNGIGATNGYKLEMEDDRSCTKEILVEGNGEFGYESVHEFTTTILSNFSSCMPSSDPSSSPSLVPSPLPSSTT